MGQRLLTDGEIRELLSERKPLDANWQTRLKTRPKSEVRFTHREADVKGDNEHNFRVILRQNTLNILDFSIILTFIDDSGEYILTRFNGKHPSAHTNKWEKAAKVSGRHEFRNTFHTHRATERYQVAGYAIDGYAEETTEYSSFETALDLFVRSNGFQVPPTNPGQMRLFANPNP
jgi:hypothetical protein